MENHSLFDWVSILGPVLLSWPLLISIVLILFYKPLFNLLDKVSGQDIQKAKIGPFEIQEAEKDYVEAIKLLYTSLISEAELHQMQQLNNSETNFPYTSDPDFIQQLKHLHSLGFISAKTELDALPHQGDLKPQVELSDRGKQYLSLRENLLTKSSED